MTRSRILRTGFLAALAAAGLLGLLALALYWASQRVPQFYEEAVSGEPAAQEAEGDRLEQQVLELHNSARRDGRWRVVFTDAQMNGWLAVDLPDKFPNLLPEGASDPRVAIQPPRIRLACRYRGPKLSAVISLDVEPRLTDEPNVVAICIRSARAGALPLPQKKLLDQIEAAARDAQLELRWAQSGGDPVAMIALPLARDDLPNVRGRDIRLESIQLNQGELVLAGRTGVSEQPQEADQSGEKRTRQP